MTPRRVTLHEAAERLGVHYMTAYRYVRTGRLPAVREGAQWLVDPSELDRLAAQPSPRPRGRARAVAPARLAGRLVAGDEAGAWAIIESALASGADPTDVLVDLVAAAMREIGDGWAAGSLDVSDEHRASVVVQRIVARMGSRFTRRGRKRGTIVLGAPEGEEHALPGAILGDLLRASRFEVHDLGANTPTASFPASRFASESIAAHGPFGPASVASVAATSSVIPHRWGWPRHVRPHATSSRALISALPLRLPRFIPGPRDIDVGRAAGSLRAHAPARRAPR